MMEAICDSFNQSAETAQATDLSDKHDNDPTRQNHDQKANILDRKQSPLDGSLDSETIQLKVKRCKHGRIIVKDKSRKRCIQNSDIETNQIQSQMIPTDDTEKEVEERIQHVDETSVGQDESCLDHKSGSTSFSVRNSDIKETSSNNTSLNNNDSNHISLEPTSASTRSDINTSTAPLEPSTLKLSPTERSPDARETERLDLIAKSPKRIKPTEDSKSIDHHKNSPKRDRIASSSRRRYRSRSPRRNRSRSPIRDRNSSHRKHKSHRGSLERSRRDSPKSTNRYQHSSRAHSPKNRQDRSHSKTRDAVRKRVPSHQSIKQNRNFSNSPSLDVHRRHKNHRGPSSDRQTSGKEGIITSPKYNVQQRVNDSIDTARATGVKFHPNDSQSQRSREKVTASSAQSPRQTINPSLPKGQILKSEPVHIESSPHRTISAHSSMIFSSDGGDNESVSNEIYDPEGPVISISSGDSPPVSPIATANQIHLSLSSDRDKNDDDMPSSAVQLNQQEKYLQKLNRQERVVEEVKIVLRPHYQKRSISKEQYKDVLRRAVPKVS